MKALAPIFLLALVLPSIALADGPADNQTNQVRRIPPPGVMIAESDRIELQAGLDKLAQQIQSFRERFPTNSTTRRYLPDVQIFENAVRYALRYDEFYNSTNEVLSAKALLQEGFERMASLEKNQALWSAATGLVVRGYLSKIDGSVQPFGLVVPPGYRPGSADKFRLDAWLHGRDEKLTELSFLTARQKSAGEFQPPQAFVLHLYGRYCNANKFAGEVDLFEALDRVRQEYPIDDNRIVVRGFSMGGAACWQFATHFAGLWAAAAPGAGFAETADFLKVFQSETVQPPSYEQKLWHWYDSTDYAVNLFNCPTVAYSGEIDKQRQAADKMAQALRAESIELAQIIGPQTGHRYHPDSKVELNRRIDSIVAGGRDPVPRKVRFTTWTLRYNQMLWVTVDGLGQHWERARVDAELVHDHTVQATTENVAALTFSMASGLCPLDLSRKPTVILDGVKMEGPAVLSDRSWTAHFRRSGSSWQIASAPDEGLRKVHGLQGPIDDAFMDSFIMVHPTGTPLNGTVAAWTAAEETHAIEHWRRQFRGEARVKNDSDITAEDIASNHLILWGDPTSNSLLQKISAQLPLRWDQNGVQAGDASFPVDHYAPVLVYPNPLNPKRYAVLNSGFTFREYDYLNNARQVPKLPDYAIIDLSVPPSSRLPGGIAKAGFFDENWQLVPQ
jgi:pimeloyl-ACP methyl ester carboxylesterase